MARRFLVAILIATLAAVAAAQGAGEEPAASDGPSEPAPAAQERGFLPSIDVYFPEGDLDVRINRLVKNAFVEGQLKYNFPNGDISAFLRYRFYQLRRTYQLTVFDAIEFSPVERLNDDFQRIRGGLFLAEWPHDYNQRSFFLSEVDRIASNKEELRFTADRTNVFLRLGYQLGTPDDTRSNTIVGETRARIERLFSSYRRIGPGGFGLTGAATLSSELFGSDFKYLKLELESLKRFDLSARSFLISRLHFGTFPVQEVVRSGPDLEPFDRLSIPRTEFFRLDGRDNLRGIKDRLRGTDELHVTAEYFFPWFLDRSYRALGLDWEHWYWVIYAGAGTVGFDSSVFAQFENYIPDVGVGFEASISFKSYRFFFAAIVAQPLGEDQSPKARLSIKSYH